MFDPLSLELKVPQRGIAALKENFTQFGDNHFITDLQTEISNISSEVQTNLMFQQQPDIASMINAILERIQVNISNIEQDIKTIKSEFDQAKKEIDQLSIEYTKISSEIDKTQQIIQQEEQEEQEDSFTEQTDADLSEKRKQLQLAIRVLMSEVDAVESKLNEINSCYMNFYDNFYKESPIELITIKLLQQIIKQRERIAALEVNLKQLDASIFDSLRDRNTRILSEINDMQQSSTDQNDSDLNEERLRPLRDATAALTSDIYIAENKLNEHCHAIDMQQPSTDQNDSDLNEERLRLLRDTTAAPISDIDARAIESGITELSQTELSQDVINQRRRIEALRSSITRLDSLARFNVSFSADLRTQISNISDEVQRRPIWQQHNDIVSMIRSISEKICASIPNVDEQTCSDFNQVKETIDLLQQEDDTNFDEMEQQLQNTIARLTSLYEKLPNKPMILQLFQEGIATLDNLFRTEEHYESKLDKSNKIKSRKKHIMIAVTMIATSIVCPVAIVFFKIQKLLFLALRVVVPFSITGFTTIVVTVAFFIYQKHVSETVGKKLANTNYTISEDNSKLNSLIQNDQNDSPENFCQVFRQMLTQ